MKFQSALALPIAAACLVFLGPNIAAARTAANADTSNNTMHVSNAGRSEAMKMVPARADLTHTLNAKDVRVGQTFEAKLAKSVQLKNGPKLPRGSELVGKVIKDQTGENGEQSVLTLRFTQAHLKNGKTVPIKATIVGIYSGSSGYNSYYAQTQTPNYWTPSVLQVDQINALHNVDLHSKIAGHNSGVLESKRNDIRFSQGTEFAIAIAKRG
jgi:hypothetical protein